MSNWDDDIMREMAEMEAAAGEGDNRFCFQVGYLRSWVKQLAWEKAILQNKLDEATKDRPRVFKPDYTSRGQL